MRETFDVFFSYSTADHASVERIARALHSRGIRVFLDRWYLAAGQPWPQALEQTLDSCNAVAVFIGAGDLGPWQQRERDLALDRQGREAAFPVVPVLLPGADPALGFLRLNTWVDFSAGPSEDEALDLLVAAIRGEPPGPLASQHAEAARAAICPYRGLRPFREEDEPFFFGRGEFTKTLAKMVGRQSFVAVVGASGSGKSSVVRAGLIRRLRRGEDKRVWEAVSFFPTDRPLASLAAALLPLLEPDLSEVDRLTEIGKLSRALGGGEVALGDVTARILAKQPGTDRLLLFVDQWEELYTLCADEAARATFITQLLEAARSEAVSVVLTVRGDFMGRVLANRGLSDQLQDAVVNVGPMTRDELAETIVRPAEKTSLAFEPGLVETILDEVGDEPGNLPLLEFLLEALWTERRGAVLHYEAYHKLGRVAGAIAHRADEIFMRELDDSERQAAQRLLIRMVRPGEGVEDTRQRAAMPAADPVAETTIRKLADARLVVTELDAASGRETVEVAHEALIRNWQRLRGWIDQDREFLRTRERIAAQAHMWAKEERSPERLLPPGRPLAEGEDLIEKRRADLDPELKAYIEASAAAAKLEKEREIERARKVAAVERGRRRVAVAGMLVALLLMSVAGLLGWQAMQNALDASRQADRADASAAKALQEGERAEASGNEAKQRLADLQRQESVRLAGMAREETRSGNAVNGMLLALEALPTSFHPTPNRPVVGDAVGALIEAMLEQRERVVLRGHEDAITSLVFSQDGKTIATASRDGTVRIWDALSGRELARLPVKARIEQAVLTPDGTRLLTLSSYDVPRMWDVASESLLFTLGDKTDVNYYSAGAQLSSDGRRALTYGDALWNLVYVWDVESGERLHVLKGHSEEVRFAIFSNDGERILTGSKDSTARVWEAKSGKTMMVLRGHTASVVAGAFSLDGQRIITAAQDATARLWDANTGTISFVLPHHTNNPRIRLALFNRNGSRALTEDSRSAHLWDTANGKELQVFPEPCDDLSFFGEGKGNNGAVVAVCGNRVRFWDAERGEEINNVQLSTGRSILQLVSFYNTYNQAFVDAEHDEFDNLSYLFATVLGDDARIWDLINDEMRRVQELSPDVLSAEFAQDGHRILMKSEVKAWEWTPGHIGSAVVGELSALPYTDLISSVITSDLMRIVVVSEREGPIKLLDGRAGTEIASLHAGGAYLHAVAVFSAGGSRLVTAVRSSHSDSREDPQLWDGVSGAFIADLRGHHSSLAAVEFNANGTIVATSGEDGRVLFWNAADGRPLAELPGYSGGSRLLALSADGTRTLEESFNHTLLVRDVMSGTELIRLDGHEEEVEAASFSADGSRIVTASAGSVRIWDTGSGQEQIVLRHYIEGRCISAEFSPDGNRLATVHSVQDHYMYSAIRLWPLPRSVEGLVAEARGRLPRQLSDEERRRYFLQ